MTSLELSIDLWPKFPRLSVSVGPLVQRLWQIVGIRAARSVGHCQQLHSRSLPIKCALDGRCFKRKPQSATPEHYSYISLVCSSSSVLGGGKSDVTRLKAEIRSTCESLLTAGTRPGQWCSSAQLHGGCCHSLFVLKVVADLSTMVSRRSPKGLSLSDPI